MRPEQVREDGAGPQLGGYWVAPFSRDGEVAPVTASEEESISRAHEALRSAGQGMHFIKTHR